MDNWPLVTVITPTHNIIEKGLVDDFNILTTLLSRQSYPNIEHIIIDKVSNDGTVQLLSDYKSKGYLQFYSEPDTGRFDALNKGIMRAKGKYVLFLNPGDFIQDIMAIEELVVAMEENEADYSFGTSYALHPEGYIIPFVPSILNVFQVLPCALQAMIFKKDVLARENYFDTKLRNMADFDLVMRLVLKEYSGILFDKNYVTYKISKDVAQDPELSNKEAGQVYIKNFRSLYPLNQSVVDKITNFSEFPEDLLKKLSTYFPEENREAFFTACEEMHQLRLEAYNEMTGANKGIENEISDVSEPQPEPANHNIESNLTLSQGFTKKPQMPGMSGQPMRHTNPLSSQPPRMPGMNP